MPRCSPYVQLHGPHRPRDVQEFQEGMVQLHTAIQNAVLAEYGLRGAVSADTP